jgi:hypothetical protein
MGGPKGEITPNAGPCVACGMDFFLTADFIYWNVREDHLGFAMTTGTDPANPAQGRIEQLNFKMKPGFKVGLGMLFDHDGWDVFAEYTWIRARNITGSYDGDLTLIDSQFWAMGIETAGSTFNSVSANWQLHYFNVIDLEMGRNFYVSRYLKLRPHFGFKGTWQKQFYNISINGNVPVDGGAVDNIISTMNQNQFYWGFGIRAGLDAAFHFSRSFSTFGELAVSGLYGQFQNNRLNRAFDNTAGTFVALGNNPRNIHNNFHTIKPVIEWQIGLRWEMYTCEKEFHFAVEAAWEEQYWLGQNQLITYFVEGRGGDLNFQGLTVKFRFDF